MSALPFYLTEDDAPAKREILRAALKLFSERGLAATSVRDIAEESGFTNPALYRHFAILLHAHFVQLNAAAQIEHALCGGCNKRGEMDVRHQANGIFTILANSNLPRTLIEISVPKGAYAVRT